MFVLSSMRWPYRTAVVSGTGVVLREFQMSQGVPLDTDYIALGAIPVPGGFLQTMVDPRSDRRRLVLMDSLGTVLSLTEIETAFGAVASSPNGRFVLALRRTDYIELVTYKVLGSAERGR
jgi:hypothetical protein